MASAPSDFFLKLILRLLSMVAGLSAPLWYYYELTDRKAAYLFCGQGTILVVGYKNLSTNKREERSSFCNNLYQPMRPYAAL
jgi:hypothetical protein